VEGGGGQWVTEGGLRGNGFYGGGGVVKGERGGRKGRRGVKMGTVVVERGKR